MCGRYVSARTEPDLIGEFECARSELPEDVGARFNVAPSQQVRVIRRDPSTGERVLTAARWGLDVPWSGPPPINARVETAASKAAFGKALAERRCLVPADGYYEWALDAAGRRRPHYLSPADGEISALAGILTTAPDGVPTMAIVTTAAIDIAATVHERMPVIVPRPLWPRWLAAGSAVEPLLAAVLAVPTPLAIRPAHPAVGDVRVDGAHLIAPAAYVDEVLTLF